MGPRARQLRARVSAQKNRVAKSARLDQLAAQWRRIPSGYRGWAPFLILVSLAITYPFYVANLPTNIPVILTLPTVHDTVTAGVVTAIGGILIGLPTLRLRGDYLAIVTLGFGEIIPQFVRNADDLHGFDLTHGTFGISPIDAPGFGLTLHNALGLPIRYDDSFPPTPDRLFFWTVLGILLLTIFCSMRLRDSRLGRAWIAIREDETAAGAMGIPLMRTKTWAYAIGAFFGGVAGAYVATFNSGAFPSQFDFNISIFLLCMVILGGMGSIWGVVLAGTILAWLNVEGLANIGSWLNSNVFPSSHQIDVPKYEFGIYGVIIVLMMLFRPVGLIPERRRKREIEEGTRGSLDEPLYEMRGADEPGAGERGESGRIPRG